MGLSPYDKQRYKESKLRRRQALLQSETGYIIPYKRSKKPLIAVICFAAVLCLAAAAAVFLIIINNSNQKAETANPAELPDEQLLRVVNRMYPLEEDYVPPLTKVEGVRVHTAASEDLDALIQKAEEQGIALTVTEGYVSFEEQKKRFEDNLTLFNSNPEYTPVRARAAAQRIVPEAGCCEAQTGLLVTFDLSDSRTRSFVELECINYGFILRYPEGKDDLTHINPSASVYRYVGAEHAAKMRSFDMCLEEYAEYNDLY